MLLFVVVFLTNTLYKNLKRKPFLTLKCLNCLILLNLASKEDEEATEMLIGNAQNLNASVKATIEAAMSASIKIKTNSGMRLRWIRKKSFVSITNDT